MKYKENDYIRTEDGIIDKVIIDYNGHCNSPNCNCKHVSCKYNYYDENTIIKSSPNIIDLIEEGDILKVNDFKDVYTIYEVEMFRNPYTNEKYLGIRNDIGRKPKRLGEIPLVNLLIVTKEQFESMEYKL